MDQYLAPPRLPPHLQSNPEPPLHSHDLSNESSMMLLYDLPVKSASILHLGCLFFLFPSELSTLQS